MQSLNDDERKEVLGEVLADELKAIHELVKDVPKISLKVDKIEVDVDELKNDMKAVKAAVTDQSKQLKEHEIRITQLESV
jgi:hypothetical protein